ncbi:ATP-binding protein [Pseudonocardia phyllosphaerae]|uniref:ATP-binding protein n=1 Tax=Pseudonocardia phyllosphaerae TaxID=3390502 RepID=UPI00397945FF
MSTAVESPEDLVHRAVPYRDPEHQADVLRAQVGTALDEGRHAIVAVEQRCRVELERALGRDAEVRYWAPEQVHSAPPFTVAGRWGRAVRDALAAGATGVCTVGQMIELPHAGPSYWTRLDLALGRVLQDLPVNLLCCFPDRTTTREEACALHDELLVDGRPVPSSGRRPDHELLREHPQPPPDRLGAPLLTLPVELGGLATMRRAVEYEAMLSGLGPGRVEDLVLAVNELVSNGIEHGSGSPTLRLWRAEAGFVAEMADADPCRLVYPGLDVPSLSGPRGRGLWLASELTDVLQVWTADDDPGSVQGTVVRVTMAPP